ncbi:unnamed protein product [Triticum turgidum subsp. durum]|uniref:DUF659 domain-containing protein n=1 Tax=Triticum turgidum subsp. durum TaxID=4567 RepID=A0A9R1A7P5_TRITD|nr:unnamed protein product [Triticum turgidum subsp. durum]
MNKKPKTSSGERVHLSSSMDMSSVSQLEQSKPLMEADVQFDSWAEKAIRNFIFEVGLGPRFVYLTSFKEMLQTVHNRDVEIPTYESMLREELKETQHRAMQLKQEWKKSGCSIIMDSWKSQCGTKSFISVLVHCSKGMYFLRSIDVSGILEDMDELVSVFSRVVDDVGARNIVQVIRNDVSPHMRMAWHYVQKEHDHSFFVPLCADFCINLLLEKIAAFDHVSEVLRKAKEITRFIYGNVLAYELVGRYIDDGEILSNSCFKSVAEFITLDRLVSMRENLVEMFSSPEWVSSDRSTRMFNPLDWISSGFSTTTSLFRHICGIVKTDDAFWCAAADVLKITKPFINVLLKLESEDCPMGILYDTMASAKDIMRNLGGKYGDILHWVDEICGRIEACTTAIAKGHYDPGRLKAQIEVYKGRSGSFGSDSAIQQIVGTPQVVWWSAHGTGMPELQSFATRVLCQTCFGAKRYNISRQVSEEAHETRGADLEELYRGLEYVHYNRRFASAAPLIGGLSGDQCGKPGRKLGSDWFLYPRHRQHIVIGSSNT